MSYKKKEVIGMIEVDYDHDYIHELKNKKINYQCFACQRRFETILELEKHQLNCIDTYLLRRNRLKILKLIPHR